MHPFSHLSIWFWLYTALQCRSSMSSNCLVFHTSGGIVLSFVGMHFAAASRCALTKFSYSSFGVHFPSSLVVFRICFLILIRIYLLYLCCSEGPWHSVWWSLFVWRFFVGLAVFSPWLFGDRRTHPRKRSMPHNSLHYFSISWGVGLLIGPRVLKTLNSIEKIQPRMMAATFNGNPRATIISCYSPTNVSEETELVTFYDELSSLVRRIPKHNMLVIGGDMNAQIGKNGNNKYSLHNTSNRNG